MLLTLNYLNLITSEHRTRVKYMAMLEAIFEMFVECGNQMENISSYMDIDTAVGDQLTLIGKWLGQSRDVSIQTNGELGVIEDDETFRFLLKAKILRNSWDGTIEQVISIFEEMLPESFLTFVDNQDMTCDIVIISRMTNEQKILVQNNLILPKPAGVTYEYNFFETPGFGWDTNTQLIKGWDESIWSEFIN